MYRHKVGHKAYCFADLKTLLAKATPVRLGKTAANVCACTIISALSKLRSAHRVLQMDRAGSNRYAWSDCMRLSQQMPMSPAI